MISVQGFRCVDKSLQRVHAIPETAEGAIRSETQQLATAFKATIGLKKETPRILRIAQIQKARQMMRLGQSDLAPRLSEHL